MPVAFLAGQPGKSSLERRVGEFHDLVVDRVNDAAQCGEVGQHVLGEESRGGDLAL